MASVEILRSAGLLDWLLGEVLERRAGAYEPVDVVLFLMCFFASSPRGTSLGDFGSSSGAHGHELAAVGGRVRWPHQSSVSRALDAVGMSVARGAADKLLTATAQVSVGARLSQHTGYRDGLGRPWWTFFWDTTVEATRKRALPAADGLPEALRLADGLAAAGYAGRKRGERVYARSTVADATTGSWIHVDLCPGSGSVDELLDRAVGSIVDFARGVGSDLDRNVVVCDGVSGGIPQVRAVIGSGMHIVTRSAMYSVLDTDKAQHLMEQPEWLTVEDSLSGPKRQAADLGVHQVDGVSLRVVVSRFAVTDKRKKRGAGKRIGDWHYELYFTTLPHEAWAANDTVTLYYARTAIENRYAAEDREFDLGRVFSYSVPGQLLACAVAMSQWNIRTALGIASVSDSPPSRPQRERPESTPIAYPTTPDNTEDIEHGDATATTPDLRDAERKQQVEGAGLEGLIEKSALQWCQANDGWTYRDGKLVCAEGIELKGSIRILAGSAIARFRARRSACSACDQRTACSPSDATSFRKEVTIRLCREEDMPPRHTPAPGARTFVLPRLLAHTSQPQLPPNLPDAPVLVTSALRRGGVRLLASITVNVTAPIVKEPEPDPEHLALTPAKRQRRRLSIAERNAINARPGDDDATQVVLHAYPACTTAIQEICDALRSA